MSSEATKPITTNRRHLIAQASDCPSLCCLRRVERDSRHLGSLPAAAAGNATVPFGSHTTSYAAGTIKPSTAQSTMDSATLAFYTKWKSRYLVSACGNGNAITSPDADHPFVAEAQGYGLELFALMAGADSDAQASFDSVLKFVLAHPSSITPGLLAAEQDSSCKSVNGSDSATDGDLAVAYGLLLADRQWGSAGAYNYKSLAAVADQCHQGRRDQSDDAPATVGRLVVAGRQVLQLNAALGLHDRPLPRLQGRNGRCHLGPSDCCDVGARHGATEHLRTDDGPDC
ncbi:MAG: glycosyl hydrolase family 8 [Candidatus Nanopelagicales bacterium]